MTVLLAQSHPTAEAGEALRIRKQDLAERKFDRCWTASTDEQIIADVGLYRQRRLDGSLMRRFRCYEPCQKKAAT